MKIEIEFEEVERLRSQNTALEDKIAELKNKIQELKPDFLEERAIDLANQMFEEMTTAVFEKLGFDKKVMTFQKSIEFDCAILYKTGNRWWKHKDIQVNIGANISKEYRRAFIQIGLKMSDLVD